MKADVQRTLDRLDEENAKKHAAWDSELFRSVCESNTWRISRRWEDRQERDALVVSLDALCEAIGKRHITAYSLQRPGARSAQNLFSDIFASRIFWGRARVEDRLELVATLWNLCEGLYQQPAWMDRYVTGYISRNYPDLDEIPAQVEEALGHLLAPLPKPTWSGSAAVIRLDMSEVDDDFLPGVIYRGGPRMLYVKDRRTDIEAAIFLRPDGESEVVGEAMPLQASSPGRTPPIRFEPGLVKAGAVEIELPLFRTPLHSLSIDAGYIAASTRDSQCVWIAEVT